jgi:hypothetical protein
MHPEPSDDAAFEHTHVILAVVCVHADQHGPLDLAAPTTVGSAANDQAGSVTRFPSQGLRRLSVEA